MRGSRRFGNVGLCLVSSRFWTRRSQELRGDQMTDDGRGLLELVGEYAAAASLHDKGTRAGDRNLTNRSHDRLASVYRTLRGRGIDAQNTLLTLLEHADPAVRLWAGAHALEFASEHGEPVLNALAAGPPSPEQLDAKYTLMQWRDGTLKFP